MTIAAHPDELISIRFSEWLKIDAEEKQMRTALEAADELCKAAVSLAGDVGTHHEAWIWDKIEEYRNLRSAVQTEPSK
jgi:hypothetical protein